MIPLMRRAIRRSLVGAAALAAVAAVIAVPHLAGRAEPAPPPTAPPIPGQPLPPAPAPAGGEPAAEPAPPPLQRLVPPSKGALLGVSNPALPREAGAVDDWSAEHAVRPRIVNWFQQWLSGETALPRRLGGPGRRAGRGPHDHLGAVVGAGRRDARSGAARCQPGPHRRRRPRPVRPLVRARGRHLPRAGAPAAHARDERALVLVECRGERQHAGRASSPPGGTCTASSPRRGRATSAGSGRSTTSSRQTPRPSSPSSTRATATSTGSRPAASTGARPTTGARGATRTPSTAPPTGRSHASAGRS